MKKTKFFAVSYAQTLQFEAAFLGFHTCLTTCGVDSMKFVEVDVFYKTFEEKKSLDALVKSSHLRDYDTYRFVETDSTRWLEVVFNYD